MNKIKKYVIIIVIISFIIFFVYHFYLSYQGKQDFIKKSYKGIITEIHYIEGKRDLPDIKINNKLISIDIDESKVKPYIQIGDSILKKSGTETIKVYRKNSKGEWYVKIFK